MKILIIEDDPYIVDACKEALQYDYEIKSASSLGEGRERIEAQSYDLILLDVELPDGNGINFIQELRQTINIPIIFISVHDQDEIISQGLDFGADDYLIKPFSLKVLKSRIKSVMRRYYGKSISIYTYDDLVFDLDKQIVMKNNKVILLTATEMELFILLIKARGKVLTRRYLLETVWDNKGEFVEDNTLTVTIKRLKDKIGSEYIKTKRNVGYYFEGGNGND